jgi:hypothetical protein
VSRLARCLHFSTQSLILFPGASVLVHGSFLVVEATNSRIANCNTYLLTQLSALCVLRSVLLHLVHPRASLFYRKAVTEREQGRSYNPSNSHAADSPSNGGLEAVPTPGDPREACTTRGIEIMAAEEGRAAGLWLRQFLRSSMCHHGIWCEGCMER